MTDGYGIFNVHMNLSVCRTHKGESHTNNSAQELTWSDRKTFSHPALPGDRTQGLQIRTTELPPPSFFLLICTVVKLITMINFVEDKDILGLTIKVRLSVFFFG